jgi:hypothetical protein
VTITEKIDGTNASVRILEDGTIEAYSRKRRITPDSDNFGFARWVEDNADKLVNLGPGVHFGEWWGKGIQRGYDLDHKRFSLFNTARWSGGEHEGFIDHTGCYVVPVLAIRELEDRPIEDALGTLGRGSRAAPGYMNPEGIMVWHHAAQQMFKWTFGGDGHKGQ